MNILYYTNSDAAYDDILPIIELIETNIIIQTDKPSLAEIKRNNISFILSDRSRYLINDEIIDHLPGRIVNLHPSYLPWNRGYHPNYWSIKDQAPHGVTIHQINSGIDTGNIIAQRLVEYNENDTFRDTYLDLRKEMLGLFMEFWPSIISGTYKVKEQSPQEGSLYLKKDFEGEQKYLPSGWDTKIALFRKLVNEK